MIKSEREQVILAMLKDKSIVRVQHLYDALSAVSNITVRRDIARLAAEKKLLRVRGGVQRLESTELEPESPTNGFATSIAADLDLSGIDDVRSLQAVDVIILPPIEGNLSRTIHSRARGNTIFCLDESAPDAGGTYLGVDNQRAGYDVGCLAAQNSDARLTKLHCLVIGQEGLRNTRDRALGFLKGLRESFAGEVHAITVNGGGIYTEAFRQARDALEAFPETSIIFAINDHSVIAAIDAARACRRPDIAAYCIGGEGAPLFDELMKNQLLRGFAAMFPQVVARSAVNAITRFFSDAHNTEPVITPHRIITQQNICDFFVHKQKDWELLPAVLDQLVPMETPVESSERFHSVLFISHYAAHHWYRILSDEIRKCCAKSGYAYHTASVKSQVLHELRTTRQEIATRASQLVRAGQTIILQGGKASRQLALALRDITPLTVITNSLPIMEILLDYPGVKVILTGGEVQKSNRELVGRGMTSQFKNIRVDTAFLAADGLSISFGASCNDEKSADCMREFAEIARKSVVLADHSIMERDANFRAIPLQKIDEIVTDFGVPVKQRLEYKSQGVGMTVTG